MKQIGIIILCAFSNLFPTSQWNALKNNPPVDLEQGLMLFLPFNGNATDNSAYEHETSVHNTALTTDRNGNTNSAYSFNGRNSYIDVAHSNCFNLNGEATFSAWIYQTSINQDLITPTLYSGRIIEKGNAGVNNGFMVDAIHAVSSDPNLNNCPDEHTAIRFIGGDAAYANKNCYGLNQWQHITVTFRNGVAKIYYNGVLAGKNILSNTRIPNNQLPVRIGATQPLQGFNHLSFRGKIDEVRIYNRALTEREIQVLYQL